MEGHKNLLERLQTTNATIKFLHISPGNLLLTLDSWGRSEGKKYCLDEWLQNES